MMSASTVFRRHLLSALACTLLHLSCSPDVEEGADRTDAAATQVKLALNWFPEAEHGGYYAAQVHGFFTDAGVEVDILAGGPDAPVILRVATGAVEFGVTNADGVLNALAAGARVVAVMAPYQTNPRCIMVHEETGIESIADLTDLTLALSQRPAFSHYLRAEFAFENVTVVPYHGGVGQFLLDPRFAQQAYVFSEPVIARRKGAAVRTLMVAETGFNPYASVLITTAATAAQRPELVRAVTAASVLGWEHYLRSPADTNRHINGLNPEMDLGMLAAGAEASRELVLPQTARHFGLGHMTVERWDLLHRQMTKSGVLDSENQIRPQSAFTNRFLPERAH